MTNLLILVVFLSSSASQFFTSAHINRIIGGKRAREGQFPSFAQLYVIFNKRDLLPSSCGATLIHKQWILSAGHCLNEADTAWVNMGTLVADDTDGNINKLETYHVHPGYVLNVTVNGDVNQCLNDIAVGKLEKKYELGKYIQPIYLPSRKPLCAIGTVVGIGQSEFYPDIIDDYIKYAETRSKKRKALGNPNIIPPSKTLFFSEKPLERRGYIYRGDSGGPFICTFNGVQVQYGIISQTDNDTERATVQSAYETVYMHLDFILKYVPHAKIYKKRIDRMRSKMAKAVKNESTSVGTSFLIAIFLKVLVKYPLI